MTCRVVFSVSVFSTGTRWTVRTRRHAEPFVEIYDAGRPGAPPAGRARARVLTACLGVLLLFTYGDWCDARSDDYSQEYWSVGRRN